MFSMQTPHRVIAFKSLLLACARYGHWTKVNRMLRIRSLPMIGSYPVAQVKDKKGDIMKTCLFVGVDTHKYSHTAAVLDGYFEVVAP
jgi:hypothetical protein